MKQLLPSFSVDRLNAVWFRRIINIYPPYLGSGARVRHISEDFKHLVVTMPLTWYNRNAVGKHFGGSLFSMTDPFYMLMLMKILGSDYIVWDKRAAIDYLLPGQGTMTAEFKLSDEQIQEILIRTRNGKKYLPEYTIPITDPDGRVVAKVNKTLYIRKKN